MDNQGYNDQDYGYQNQPDYGFQDQSYSNDAKAFYEEEVPESKNSAGAGKVIAIVITLLITIAIAVTAYFLFFNKTTPSETLTEEITASDIQKYMPEYTEEEIQNILDTPLTDEQIANIKPYDDTNYVG